MTNITGSCLCGNLRYTVRSDPVLTGICHCKSCQKQTGAAFAVAIVVPKSSLSIEGDLASFEVVGASGLPTRRVFCPKCGSPIAVDPSSNPNRSSASGNVVRPVWRDLRNPEAVAAGGAYLQRANRCDLERQTG